MSISNRRVTSLHLYSMLGHVLSKVDNIQYLGITIASNLRWENHITGLTAKVNRTLGFLRRNLRTCPQQLRQLAYFSLVRSRLEYSSVAWDPYLAKDITKLESIQRRAARFTMNDHRRRSSVSNMLERLGWEPLQERRAMACLTIMKKILSGRVAINCDEYLERSSTRTRTANSAKFKHYRTNTEVFKNSYFPRTVPLWNGMPDQFVNTLTEVSGCPVALGTSLD